MREKRKTLDNKDENLKFKKIAKKQKWQERGITLIALVVTIIILLILSGVTLSIALSDGGLFSKTKKAADDYKQAQTNEEGLITDIEKELDKYGSGNPTPSKPTPSEGTPTPIPIDEAKAKGKFEKTETVTDENGNKVVIPGEFKISSDSGTTVKDGIVVEDTKGNQFVWIPVSNVDGGKNPASSDGEDNLVKVEEGKTVEITLGRYTFDTQNGTPTLKQNGNNQKTDIPIETYYNESIVTDRTNGGERAKNLGEFIQSVEDNHGYYIARYEASYKSGSGVDDYKPYTKPSTSNSTSRENKIPGMLWNFITQEDASKASQNMYSEGDVESDYIESDLVNSYAWDTAMVYIQAMKGENKNYANQKDGNGDLKNTGTTSDEKCHIFDMAGNLCEWTTEYSSCPRSSLMGPYVYRGGGNYDDTSYAARRCSYVNYNGVYDFVGFRPLLYLKQL